MERRDFLNNLGQVSVAVCAARLLAACSKSDNNPDPPGGGGGGGNNARLTANLSSEIMNIGDSKINGSVIAIRIATGNTVASFVALSLICTHEGCTVNYDAGANDFKCPCHGSEYSISGAVNQGPATASLTKYNIAITDNILRVT